MLRLASFFIAAGLLCGCSDADAPSAELSALPETQVIGQPATSVGGPSPAPIDRDRHIVLVADPWCPHNCVAGSASEGYIVDIAREIFTGAGYTVNYQNISWARALKMTRDGEFNAVVGALRSDAPDFVFPDVPQGRASISLFTHSAKDWVYQGIPSLENQTLLAINGYSYTAELDEYIERNLDNRERIWILSGVAPLERALHLLEKNRTDVFVEDEYVMAWKIGNNPSVPRPRKAGQIRETMSYVAFSPALENSAELARLLSEGTQQLIDNGRIKAILDNYGLIESPERP